MMEAVASTGAEETTVPTEPGDVEEVETGIDEAAVQEQLEREYREKKERLDKLEAEASEMRIALAEKDREIAHLRDILGLTAVAQLKRSVETSTIFVKTKELGDRVKSSETYQKTTSTLSAAGQSTATAVGTAASKTGEALSSVATSVKESQTWQSMGDRMRSASQSVKEKFGSQRSYSESSQNHEAEESRSYTNTTSS